MKHVCSALLISALYCTGLAAERPNVLLIMADDFRDFGGAFSREVVKVPNLDRLRSRGITFERAYVQYPVCNPSRASMMTGLRSEETGIFDNSVHLREKMPDVVTLPQLFKDAGWQAHAFGKLYHLGAGKDLQKKAIWSDEGRSWQTATDYRSTKVGRNMIEGRNVTGGALKWCEWGIAAGGDDDQPDGQIASATISMIQKLGDKPWFIGCGFMKPHDPFIAPKKYYDLYPSSAVKHWRDPKNLSQAPPEAVGFGGYAKAFGKFTDQEWGELFRAYCAGTSFMDAQLGRVLDALDQHKLWDKTIVVFVGDHGYHTGEREWFNKDTLFERCCRAPLVIAAPGVKGGQTTRSLVEFIDLYPTLADLAGLKVPHTISGTSLKPLLVKPSSTIKEVAFTLVSRAKHHGRSVRTSRWRFTQWSDGEAELYDHDKDPEETHNVAKTNQSVVAELKGRLEKLPTYQAN